MRIAVTSRSFSRHPTLRAELIARYPDVVFNDTGRVFSTEELRAFLLGSEKAIVGLERIDEAVLAALPELKVIAKYGVGFDSINLNALRRHQIRLGRTDGVNRRSVSELVIATVIALLRQVPAASAELRSGSWRPYVGRQLSGRTVGIVGCGHIGKDLAILLRSFGCRVLAHDIRHFPEFYSVHGIEPADFDALLRMADIVTLHLPLDSSTRGILDARRLRLMRSDAILVNMARGGLIDENELTAMLKERRLAGAVLDVFAVEPPANSELISLPNVLATPHIGGSADEAILAMGRAAIRGLDENRVPEPGIYPEGSWIE